jgi:hypothetical protein
LVGVSDYFQAKKSAKLAVHEHEQQLNTVLYHSKQPLLMSRQNPAYAATWATFILAKRRTINRLIVA